MVAALIRGPHSLNPLVLSADPHTCDRLHLHAMLAVGELTITACICLTCAPRVRLCALVQIMSANAYFLVYRQCPAGSQQSQAAAEAVAAPAGQPAAAATAQAAADAPQQAAAQVSVKQDDSAQQQPSQPQPLSQPLQALDQNQQPAAQPAAVSVKQEASTHQAGVPQQQQQQQLGDLEGVSEQQQQQQPLAAQQLQAQLQELPDAVQQQVAQLHRDFDDACHKFQQHKQEALAAVEQRQQVRHGAGTPVMQCGCPLSV